MTKNPQTWTFPALFIKTVTLPLGAQNGRYFHVENKGDEEIHVQTPKGEKLRLLPNGEFYTHHYKRESWATLEMVLLVYAFLGVLLIYATQESVWGMM